MAATRDFSPWLGRRPSLMPPRYSSTLGFILFVYRYLLRRNCPRRCCVLLGLSFRNKSSKDMAFPHPKSGKNKYRKEDKPNGGGVGRNLFKRTIDITEEPLAKLKH